MAHVRHDQRVRLARRPGRDRIHVPHGAPGRLRARALRHALRPQCGRHDLPASVRRPHGEFRRKTGPARVRRRRPDRARAFAHALPAKCPGPHAVLRRVDGARPRARCRRRRPRRRRAGDGDRRRGGSAGEGDDARDRRGRAHLRRQHQCVHQHGRRPRHGRARRDSARGHGILAVPPDRRGRRRGADHRRRARRGRHSPQLQRRALHGALCAEREGSRIARRLSAGRWTRRSRRAEAAGPTRTTCC